jgi:translation elongation factor EF-Tu-like GTPase
VGYGENIKTTATEIHIFNNSVNECVASDHVGVLARGKLVTFLENFETIPDTTKTRKRTMTDVF